MLDNVKKRFEEYDDKDGWVKVLSRRKSKTAKEKVCVPKPSLVLVKTNNR